MFFPSFYEWIHFTDKNTLLSFSKSVYSPVKTYVLERYCPFCDENKIIVNPNKL